MRYLVIILSLCFLACEKKELAVDPHESGDLTTSSVDLGSNYRWQIFYDLESDQVVSKNRKTSWDIAIKLGAETRVKLNGAKLMFAAKMTQSFDDIIDTTGFGAVKKIDDPEGDLVKTAFGDVETGACYLMELGLDSLGENLGYYKLVFDSLSESSCTFRFAEISNGVTHLMKVDMNEAFNFMYVDLSNQLLVDVEPEKDAYDLMFTQYSVLFEDGTLPYLVTGCLINPYLTEVRADSTLIFNEVNYERAASFDLLTKQDEIGYNWKSYVDGEYIIRPKYFYVLKNRTGRYYKLRFIDYYNEGGEKGAPSFEWQML